VDLSARWAPDAAFATSARGYPELLAWLESFGQVELVGVESTGSYAAGLVRLLAARGLAVVEAKQPHAHTQRRRGKSDPLHAEAAARKALAAEATAIPKHTSGIFEYLEIFHNRQRRHPAPGMHTPIEYEILHQTRHAAA
jgi:transposase